MIYMPPCIDIRRPCCLLRFFELLLYYIADYHTRDSRNMRPRSDAPKGSGEGITNV